MCRTLLLELDPVNKFGVRLLIASRYLLFKISHWYFRHLCETLTFSPPEEPRQSLLGGDVELVGVDDVGDDTLMS